MQDPQIFTDCIKPHFEYHTTPWERFDKADDGGGRVSLRSEIRPQRYAYVEPATAFHDALNMAIALPAKAAGAAGKAVGAAGKVVGAAGMAVLHFGSTHQHGQPSTASHGESGASGHTARTSRRGTSTGRLRPVPEPAEDSAKPEIDVMKTYGVAEFTPDF